MGIYIDWSITLKGCNEKQTDVFYDALEEIVGAGNVDDLSGFHTESIRSFEDISDMVVEFSERYPSAEIEVFYHYDCDECPDKFIVKDGEMTKYKGHVEYTEVS